MSDEPFRRPDATAPPGMESWPREWSAPEEASAAVGNLPVREDPDESSAERSAGRPGIARFRSVAAVGLVALLVGLSVGALARNQATPTSTPITVESFPRKLLGLTREDFALRGGGSDVVMARLDAHFAAQLDGFRFAYGGDGAQFRYGEFTTLTIVNGQLAPDVPVSDDTEWATPTVISLNTRDTTCVSWRANNSNGFVFINVKTGLPLDPIRADGPVREAAETVLWTDCVLFDRQRNLALRLDGRAPSSDILEAAGQFRDELERIHADLIA